MSNKGWELGLASCGQGGGGKKTGWSCGRNKWMTPMQNIYLST